MGKAEKLSMDELSDTWFRQGKVGKAEKKVQASLGVVLELCGRGRMMRR